MNKWLAALEWGLVLAAAGTWVLFADRIADGPSIGAGLCWGTAWVARRLRLGVWTRRTAIDGPLAAYTLASLVAVWPATDAAAAGARIGLLLGAIGIFYALINASPTTIWRFGDGVALAGALFALFFVTQHDWLRQPTKFALIGQVGAWVRQAAPQFGWHDPHPNVAATILALCLPVPVAQAWTWLRRLRQEGGPAGRASLGLAFSGVASAAIALGLVMTESRGAALALLGAAGLGAGWLVARRLAGASGRQPRPLFVAGMAGAALILVGVAAWRPEWVGAALGSLPGPNSVVSRLEVFGQVWRLAQDTPYTGGGLAAFPALYSTHILGIPYLFLTHAHNAYLNVLVEQGFGGGLSYLAVIVTGGWAALGLSQRQGQRSALAAAGTLVVGMVALQGLADGTLVASRAAALWLVPFGLALQTGAGAAEPTKGTAKQRVWMALGVGLLAVAATALMVGGPGRAAWYANQAAVQANRVLLAGFPTNSWSTGQEAPRLTETEPGFRRALALAPNQRTSHYFLGVIAERQRDYASAVSQWQAAYASDPGHRGIVKSLAYGLVWQGDLDAAAPLLRAIPEAQSEMEVYAWWWGTQQRPDLAERASAALAAWPAAP